MSLAVNSCGNSGADDNAFYHVIVPQIFDGPGMAVVALMAMDFAAPTYMYASEPIPSALFFK
ncbi:hypothetical protein CP532_2748, partial [Ophiocordyceps camponoti-leonardi (nom. inval.)]